MRLLNKVAVITGAKGGIGLATAALFAQEGSVLAIAGMQDASAEARMLVESGATACFIRADLSDEAKVRALFAQVEAEYGRLDILVNNAAFDAGDALLCANAAIPLMVRSGGGSIINVLSELASIDVPGIAEHGTTKSELVRLTSSLAAAHANDGIRVNALCLGPTPTQPREVAAACTFIVCDESSFVTGATLVLDGGRAARAQDHSQ